MKDLYNAIHDALTKYGYIIPTYNDNKLPSELTTATIEVDSVATLQAGFSQYSADITLTFYNENEKALTDTVEAFIMLIDRADRDTEEEKALPENESTLRLLDRSNISSIETDKDSDNGTLKTVISLAINFEIK